MILFRSVGLQELELIYDSGMKAFPARLSQQPIFYPVLQLDYARQIASDWNTSRQQSAGYVTQFKVDDDYIDGFEIHAVGASQHQELWIPAEHLDEFNRHIAGPIKIVDAYFGDGFEGFIPDAFGMQGKSAVEQFTWLANTFIYKRLDFYLELKRNHKAVFLNYPFWLRHDFQNPGLNEKVVKAIREGWLASFPQVPLMNPIPEAIIPIKQPDSNLAARPVHPVQDDIAESTPAKPLSSRTLLGPVHKMNVPIPISDSDSVVDAIDGGFDDDSDDVSDDVSDDENDDAFSEEIQPVERPRPNPVVRPVRDDAAPVRAIEPARERAVEPHLKRPPEQQPFKMHVSVEPTREENTPHVKPPGVHFDVHFKEGVKLGLSGSYQEAIDELSKAVADHPDHAIAHTSLGVALHRVGEDDRALACYEAALQIDSHDAEAHYFRANILHSQGNVRGAIADYTVALGLEPSLIEAHGHPAPEDRLTDYTRAPAEMHRIARAARRILHLDRLLDANAGQAALFKERAAEYTRLWNYERAIAEYSSYLKLQPDDAGALHLRGLAYEQIGQDERALQDYQRAIAIDPQLADVYINRGISLGQTGNFRQSVASLTEGIRLAPENPNGYFNRGMSNFQQGDLERAIDDFSSVIRLSPDQEDAYYWRGIANEEAGRQLEAAADYRQFLALSQTHSQNPQAREEVEQRLRQWDESNSEAKGESRNEVKNEAKQNGGDNRTDRLDEGQKTEQDEAEDPDHDPDEDVDVHGLLVALGERALHSTWFASGLDCDGPNAEELRARTDQDAPIDGRELLHLASGIQHTRAADFQAFDSGLPSPWIFVRIWEESGYYIETNDARTIARLKSHFPSAEEVEGATAPYRGLLIR